MGLFVHSMTFHPQNLHQEKLEATTSKLQSVRSLHKLNEPDQVILFRLRTGQNRLNAYMYKKFKSGESEMWTVNNANIMTAEHMLQHC